MPPLHLLTIIGLALCILPGRRLLRAAARPVRPFLVRLWGHYPRSFEVTAVAAGCTLTLLILLALTGLLFAFNVLATVA